MNNTLWVKIYSILMYIMVENGSGGKKKQKNLHLNGVFMKGGWNDLVSNLIE